MTVEQILAVAVPAAALLAPLFGMLFRISGRLSRIEERLAADGRRMDEVLSRHDRQIHDIRNSLHGISLQMALMERRKGKDDEAP